MMHVEKWEKSLTQALVNIDICIDGLGVLASEKRPACTAFRNCELYEGLRGTLNLTSEANTLDMSV